MSTPNELWERVAAAARGERDAARSVFDHYERQVFAWCLLACGGARPQALELTGEVFTEAFRGLKELAHPKDFEPGLWAIAARRARGRAGDPRRQRVLETFVLQRTGGAPSVGETTEQREARLALVRAEIEKVEDERARAIGLAHFVEGQEPKAIAQAMGLPLGTVALKLDRLHDRVKRELCRWAVTAPQGGGA